MKIAYINMIFSKGNMIGVEKKLIEETKAMKKYGIDVYVLNREKEGFENNIFFKKIDNYFSHKKLFEIYLRIFKMKIIQSIIDLDQYDKIFLRYPLMDFSSLSYVKKYGSKTVTEHHGKELEEILNYKINLIFKISQYIMEKLLAPLFFKYIKAFTGISNELINYEIERTNFKGITYRFSNGIDSQKYKINFNKKFKFEKEINVLFIASNFANWHGLDRLLNSLRIYKGKILINLHIVGGLNKKYLNMINNFNNDKVKIIIYGKIYGTKLDEVYESIDIACDSLAMYRLNMKESSTLKSKEYIARGIPFLYSAIDLDLIHLKKYLYEVENNDSLIDFTKVIDFYSKINIQQMLCEFEYCAKNILDWNNKIKYLKDFLVKC